jgi:hypothetical protein
VSASIQSLCSDPAEGNKVCNLVVPDVAAITEDQAGHSRIAASVPTNAPAIAGKSIQ